MAMLEVENLTIKSRFPEKPLVNSISFTVDEGETLGLVGESGSGKTMTSRCIMRLLDPRIFACTGSIRWRGQEILAPGTERTCGYRGTQIGMIAQNPMTAFAPSPRLEKQLAMGFTLHGAREKAEFRQRLVSALASVNLPDAEKILHSYPDELSGGMLQRVMIAQTLLQNPALLIADEITTAVDAASECLIIKEMEKLNEQGMALIVITHDFGVAAKLCDTVAVMKDGEIVERGDIHAVFCMPQHEYTKRLVEASILFESAEGISC